MAKRTGAALELRNVWRSFPQGDTDLRVLQGAEITIEAGEIVGLIGPSGSGKSTLLHVAGLLETPSTGEVIIGGANCAEMTDSQRTRIRRTDIGFVYQFHHLLPEFSALENVALPQRIAGKTSAAAADRARRLLTELGLAERLDHQPMQLSGGEQQRVAIARALANAPRLLLADEPTGNLDPNTSDAVFDALLKLVREEGLAALIATHNYELADKMDRVVSLENGKLVADGRRKAS